MPGTDQIAAEASVSLRSLLLRAGLSPEKLARQLNLLASELGVPRKLDEKTPYKWFRGAMPREPWPVLTAQLLSSRLGTSITAGDLGWDTSPPGMTCPPADSGVAQLSWTVQGCHTAVTAAASARHLTFLPVAGTTLTGPALHWLTAAEPGGTARTAGPPVGDARITAIEDITASLRHLDGRHGSAPVLLLARTHLTSVTETLTQSAYGMAAGARLHAAAADLLALAGWLSFDAGQPGQAQRYWLAGLRAAHASGDRPAGAAILRHLSAQASAAGQHPEAITLAQAARRGAPGLTPRAAAVLAYATALAYARAGDHAATQTVISQATDVLAIAGPANPEPGWARWLDRAAATALTGTASLYLHDWDHARSHLTTALRALGPDRPRTRAIICTRLALAHAALGNPEPASQHGSTAARILASGTSSARCLAYLRDLQNALRPYDKNQSVTDFSSHLAGIEGAHVGGQPVNAGPPPSRSQGGGPPRARGHALAPGGRLRVLGEDRS
jgi:tetratricopeptide (TPR) repeat protein